MSQSARPTDKAVSEAVSLHGAGKLEKAEKAYRRILRRRPKDGRLLYLLGIVVHQRNRPTEAARHFRASLKADASDADTHRHLGLALKDAGQPAEAEAAYRDALAVDPGRADILANLATVLKAQGRPDAAVEALERAVTLAPASAAILTACGNALRETGRPDEAEDLHRRALRQRPDHSPSLTGLSAALWRQGRSREAAEAARQAIAQAPDLPQPHLMLGNALRGQNRPKDAMDAFRAAADIAPDDPTPHVGLAEAAQDAGALETALAEGRAALTLAPHAEAIHTVHGQTLYALRQAGAPEKAAQEAEDWLRNHPDSATAHHLAPPLMEAAEPERASASYVRATFDAFADSFDQKLGALDYAGPEIVGGLLRAARPDGVGAVLDIGCGTGLVAPALRPLADRLEGLDLSPQMLAKARTRDLYDALHEADAETFLGAETARWDALIAADVLIYLGDLTRLAAGAAQALRPGGLFIATAEEEPEQAKHGWRLHPSGRYRHSRPYLLRTLEAAGLIVERLDAVALRREGDRAVEALAVVARSPTLAAQ